MKLSFGNVYYLCTSRRPKASLALKSSLIFQSRSSNSLKSISLTISVLFLRKNEEQYTSATYDAVMVQVSSSFIIMVTSTSIWSTTVSTISLLIMAPSLPILVIL